MTNTNGRIVGLIDSHCHLTSPELEGDIAGALERARGAGVQQVVTIGTDVEDSRRAMEVAQRFQNVHATVGLCPHAFAKADTEYLAQIEELAGHPKIVAIGEIGLEYHYFSAAEDRRRQREVFAEQLKLAVRMAKPVVIHCRDAFEDCLAIVGEHAPPGFPVVFHCFTGGPDEVQRVLDSGCHVGLTGIVTFKNSRQLQAAARLIGDDRLLMETDSPYCSPVPVRSRRPCLPEYLPHTARFVAELRGQDLTTLAAATVQNTRRLLAI